MHECLLLKQLVWTLLLLTIGYNLLNTWSNIASIVDGHYGLLNMVAFGCIAVAIFMTVRYVGLFGGTVLNLRKRLPHVNWPHICTGLPPECYSCV